LTTFSRAIGRDTVPGDDTDLAVGLGRPIWKGIAPMAGKRKAGWLLEEHCYLTLDVRSKMLIESMGHKRSLKVMAWHRKKTKQVMKWRDESKNDSKEPAELMPGSYREARERALKVAAEARAPHRGPAMPKPKGYVHRSCSVPQSKENRMPRFNRRPLSNLLKKRSGSNGAKSHGAACIKQLHCSTKTHQRPVLQERNS
jgi:hypothetical protein